MAEPQDGSTIHPSLGGSVLQYCCLSLDEHILGQNIVFEKKKGKEKRLDGRIIPFALFDFRESVHQDAAGDADVERIDVGDRDLDIVMGEGEDFLPYPLPFIA